MKDYIYVSDKTGQYIIDAVHGKRQLPKMIAEPGCGINIMTLMQLQIAELEGDLDDW